MALKHQPLFHFPFFSHSSKPHLHRLPDELRFSRWNNANADNFTRRQNTHKEIQDQLRFHKRFDSAQSIAFNNYNPAPPNPTFKSTGTPSSPSLPSIPGKKSKYSKTPPKILTTTHPAFKPPIFKTRRIPIPKNSIPKDQNNQLEEQEEIISNITPNIQVDENGVNYQFPDAPFVYQYSYTETPKVKPLGIREPLVAPFQPATMGRPWTGKKPLPSSKKTLPEFDSFKLPPPHKKGVKPVQAPGPYLPGSGPKYVQSREDILGEPLTKEEVNDLIESSRKSTRQLNIGRDGLTHNMLDNIHALWKRKRVCKIKCKGVCTVDMDNVRQQLEEKSGGQVVFSRGGVIFLYRGRNYNYRFRPRFPLMLWKPVTPVYPRLIKRVPEGLTLEQATEMRRKGRTLKPICKLGKNGVYCDLVKNVKEAFEECELVRINCQGLNGSDYRKIGAKLKELVPCVLISFEEEHILMWRGQNWKSSLPELANDAQGVEEEQKYSSVSGELALDGESRELTVSASSVSDVLASSTHENHSLMMSTMGSEEELEERIKHGEEISGELPSSTLSPLLDVCDRQGAPSHVNNISDANNLTVATTDGNKESDGSFPGNSEAKPGSCMGSDNQSEIALLTSSNRVQDTSEEKLPMNDVWNTLSPSTEGVLLLRKQAVESGSALVLDGNSLDADLVFQKAVGLSKSAPNGPVYRYKSKKSEIKDSSTKQREEGSEVSEAEKSPGREISNDLRAGVRKKTKTTTTSSGPITTSAGVVSVSRKDMKKNSKKRSMKDIREDYLNIAPRGTLQVDELAKLLS